MILKILLILTIPGVHCVSKLKSKNSALHSQSGKRHFHESSTKKLIGKIDIVPYRGASTEWILHAEDLNCEFKSKCCWGNVGVPRDDLDWSLASSNPDPAKAQTLLKMTGPKAPYLITASTTTTSLTYSDLVSCTISCQSGPGTLTFKRWVSSGVKLDVCTAPSGQTEFANCRTIDPSTNPNATVRVPPSDKPFQIAIVASDFMHAPGGVAMIKDIKYDAPLCDPSAKPVEVSTTRAPIIITTDTSATTKTKPPTGPCSICDFDDGTLCQLKPGDSSSAQWKVISKRTANSAAGVPSAVDQQKYAGAELKPNEKAILVTQPLNLPDNAILKFRYYEAAHGVTLKMCWDSIDNCPFSTSLDVTAGDRKWKEGKMPVPKGKHTIHIVGDNKGGQYAGVGIDNIQMSSTNGEPINC